MKLGDRVLFAGTDDVTLATAVAMRAGLSGRVVVLAPDAAGAKARAARIEAAGAFVETADAPLPRLAFDRESFDVAVIEETLAALGEFDRVAALTALFGVLRPGGRLLWIERAPRAGLFAKPATDASARQQMLSAAGFRGVRTLAAAEGRTYVEGIKSAATGN
ncbi:MAG TPA: methyltransferase domain-containing protein [Vicinamibacterales bacterium]|nr:methyltransferase domain-containing protein [Vicinamibacterales bacterium]